MHVRWLGWAGVEVEAGDETLVIDPLRDPAAVYAWAGERAGAARLPSVVEPQGGRAIAGLLTHLHRDHADAGALAAALRPGAPVFEPHPGGGNGLEEVGLAHADHELAAAGLDRRALTAWEAVELGPFRVTALPAVDGAGDPQLSWMVEADGSRLFHGGDTLFHGYWWRIALRCGRSDVALLPISGASNDFPNRQPPSPFPAVMTPEQAAVAGDLLGAATVVPIHYGGFEFEPHYVPVPDCEVSFRAAAERGTCEATVIPVGAALSLPVRPP